MDPQNLRPEEMAKALGYSVQYINIYGPSLVGNMLSCFLLAVTIVGAWYYFQTQANDVWYNKAVIGFILFVTTLDSCFSASLVVKLMAVHPGSLIYFLNVKDRFEDWAAPLCANITAAFCQSFFVFRILRFSHAMRFTYTKRKQALVWLGYGVLMLGLALCWVVAFLPPLYLSRQSSYAALVDHNSHGNPTWGWLTTYTDLQIGSFLAFDVLITIGMTYELRSARTGFHQTNTILDSILNVILRNGVLMLCCQVLQLVVFHETTTAWTEFFPVFYGKIYAITALSLLLQPKWAQKAYIAKMDREAATHPTHTDLATKATSAFPGVGLMTGGAGTGFGTGHTSFANASAHVESGFCRSCGSSSRGAGLIETPKLGYSRGLTVSFNRSLPVPLLSEEVDEKLEVGVMADSDMDGEADVDEKGAQAAHELEKMPLDITTPILAYDAEPAHLHTPPMAVTVALTGLGVLPVLQEHGVDVGQQGNERRGSAATHRSGNTDVSMAEMLGPGIRYII